MAIVGREAALIDKMCEKEVDLEARKASRRLSLAGGVAVFSLSLCVCGGGACVYRRVWWEV